METTQAPTLTAAMPSTWRDDLRSAGKGLALTAAAGLLVAVGAVAQHSADDTHEMASLARLNDRHAMANDAAAYVNNRLARDRSVEFAAYADPPAIHPDGSSTVIVYTAPATLPEPANDAARGTYRVELSPAGELVDMAKLSDSGHTP